MIVPGPVLPVYGSPGMGTAVSDLLGEAQPGWKSALVGLAVCTALAFVLTAGAERVLRKNGRPRGGRRRRRLRRNGSFPTTRVVVTLEPNGRYTGHVLDAQSGATLAVTYAEESPFVAKREAEKLALRIERARAKAERGRPRGPYRVTPTGRTITLVPRPKK